MPQSVCDEAQRLAERLSAGDVASVVAATQTRETECPGGTPAGAGGPFPLCDGAKQGEVRIGVGMARRYSEGAVLGVPQYEQALRTFLAAVEPAVSDESGRGDLRLAGVSCVNPTEVAQRCTRAAVILTAIVRQTTIPGWGIPAGRELLMFFMSSDTSNAAASIQETWTGIVQSAEAATILRTGGVVFDLGQVFVLP